MSVRFNVHAGGPKRPAARPVAPSQPLQHTLPPNTSPQAAAEFLDTFFRGGDDTQQQPAAARTRDIALYRDPPAAAAPQPTAATAPFGAQPGAYGRVPRRGARTTALNVWESRPAPLTSVQPRAMGPLETATESATALTGGAEGAAAPRQMAGEDSATAAHHTDAGLTLGMSFRVGWGPGGQLLIPGATGHTHTHTYIRRHLPAWYEHAGAQVCVFVCACVFRQQGLPVCVWVVTLSQYRSSV